MAGAIVDEGRHPFLVPNFTAGDIDATSSASVKRSGSYAGQPECEPTRPEFTSAVWVHPH